MFVIVCEIMSLMEHVSVCQCVFVFVCVCNCV